MHPMDELDGFVLEEDGLARYHPVGSVSFDDVVRMVRAAIAAARANRATKLLIDTTALTGFSSPGILARFLAVVEWAKEAGGTVRMAMVAREEMIHQQKFGVTVAANRGFRSDIFPTEGEARAWLDA